jgi:hypothetical protein
MGMAHRLPWPARPSAPMTASRRPGQRGSGCRTSPSPSDQTATARTLSGYAVDINPAPIARFENVSLNNGDLSGLRLASSVHTSIHNLSISNFYANGLFAINDQDLRVEGLACPTTRMPASRPRGMTRSTRLFDSLPGHHRTNITSASDTETILINSCNNVTVNGFTSLGSGQREAVFVGQDPTTTTAHWPDRVLSRMERSTAPGTGATRNSATAQALYINVGTNGAGVDLAHRLLVTSSPPTSALGFADGRVAERRCAAQQPAFYDVGSATPPDACRPKATRSTWTTCTAR